MAECIINGIGPDLADKIKEAKTKKDCFLKEELNINLASQSSWDLFLMSQEVSGSVDEKRQITKLRFDNYVVPIAKERSIDLKCEYIESESIKNQGYLQLLDSK